MSEHRDFPRPDQIGQIFLDQVDQRLNGSPPRHPVITGPTPVGPRDSVVTWLVLLTLVVNTAILAHVAFRPWVALPSSPSAPVPNRTPGDNPPPPMGRFQLLAADMGGPHER